MPLLSCPHPCAVVAASPRQVDSIACGDASPRAAAKALGLGLAQLSPLSRAMCEGGLGKFTQ